MTSLLVSVAPLIRILSAISFLALASGCSDETTVRPIDRIDLPVGWEAAQPVKMFSQGACAGSAYDPNIHETLDVTAGTGSVSIAYHNAHFRCNQTVEGFVRPNSETLDVLVQPVDMNPATIVKCDCLYEITIGLDAEAGAYTVRLSRRWDHKSGSANVLLVGTASVEVP